MNRLTKVFAVIAFSGLFLFPSLNEAGVRVYVRLGPPRVRTVRVIKPVSPYRKAVWVAGHYRYTRGRYVWVKGYWLKYRSGYVYVQPHWKKTSHGYFFVPGHWKKL